MRSQNEEDIIGDVFIAIILSPTAMLAAGSCTESLKKYTGGFVVITLSCKGDSVNGSVPNKSLSNTSLSEILGTHYLYTISAYPTYGGTAPDAADVFVFDENGEDLLGSSDGGSTANKGLGLIHATLKKTTIPYSHYLSSPYYPSVTGNLTVKVTNQSTASADFTIEMVFVR
jgi:hypothetical protein